MRADPTPRGVPRWEEAEKGRAAVPRLACPPTAQGEREEGGRSVLAGERGGRCRRVGDGPRREVTRVRSRRGEVDVPGKMTGRRKEIGGEAWLTVERGGG